MTVLAKQPLYQAWVSHRIAQRNCTGPDNRSHFYGPWLISFRRRNELETVCRGAICFAPWPLAPDTEICFLFRVPAVFCLHRAFWHFNTAILAKMIFYHKLCRHPTNRKTKGKDEKKAKLHLPFSLKFCSQGTELNCSARPHCPPWVIGCGFPHPKEEK